MYASTKDETEWAVAGSKKTGVNRGGEKKGGKIRCLEGHLKRRTGPSADGGTGTSLRYVVFGYQLMRQYYRDHSEGTGNYNKGD